MCGEQFDEVLTAMAFFGVGKGINSLLGSKTLSLCLTYPISICYGDDGLYRLDSTSLFLFTCTIAATEATT
jgi:hypothetical protein